MLRCATLVYAIRDTPAPSLSNTEAIEWVANNLERVAMDTSTEPLTAKDIYPAYTAAGGCANLNTFSKALKASFRDVHVDVRGTAAYFVRIKEAE